MVYVLWFMVQSSGVGLRGKHSGFKVYGLGVRV